MKERSENNERDQRERDESVDASGLDADLLEALLSSRSLAKGASLSKGTDAHSMARSAELESFLDTCRAALATDAESDRIGARRLSERILGATTREDLSWRGDLALVTGFLRKRLAASFALRVVAASLLVHMMVAPAVLAYFMLVKPKPEVNLGFELPPPPPALDPIEPDHPIAVPPLDAEDPDLDAGEGLEKDR